MNSHLFASLRLERFAMSVTGVYHCGGVFQYRDDVDADGFREAQGNFDPQNDGRSQRSCRSDVSVRRAFDRGLGSWGGLSWRFMICCLLRRYEFIALPDIYYDRTLPVTFQPLYYFGVAGCAVLIVLVACLYPSKRAARLNPLEGIRFG